MSGEKKILKNRKGQKIVGELFSPMLSPKGTAIIQHGYSGTRKQEHILAMRDALLQEGFQVFTFDTTNSFGESDGKFEDARLGLHAEDLEDLIFWAQKENWMLRPLVLAGHSMGAFSILRFAMRHKKEVDLLIPFAPVVSGELLWAAMKTHHPLFFAKVKREGLAYLISHSGRKKKIQWSVFQEYLQHSLFLEDETDLPPFFLIGAERDTSVPVEHLSLWFSIPKVEKKFLILKQSPHTPHKEEILRKLKKEIKLWLEEMKEKQVI